MEGTVETPSPARKRLVNVFIGVMLFLMLVDGLPSAGRFHQRLKGAVDELLNVTGLWQGSWNLFAPEPDKANVRLVATVTFEDGARASWESPDWRSLSAVSRFLQHRYSEYIDAVAWDDKKAAWPALADYVARTVEHPAGREAKAVQVELERYVSVIPPPAAARWQPLPDRMPVTKQETILTYSKP